MNPAVRAFWVIDSLRDRWWLHRRLGIDRGARVLDVGSGGSPNLRSNVLCDRYVHDGTERHGNPIVRDRPLVVGDVERLPFRDHAFDFVICSHVLEHVEDPVAAVLELQRVASRGYIETPSPVWERLAGYPFHRWIVTSQQRSLTFQPKSSPIFDDVMARWYAWAGRRRGLHAWIWFNRRSLGVYTALRWEAPFDVHVLGEPPDGVSFQNAGPGGDDAAPASAAAGPVERALRLWGCALRRRVKIARDDLTELLACPSCRGDLSSGTAELACVECGMRYPVDEQGSPWLLIEAAA